MNAKISFIADKNPGRNQFHQDLVIETYLTLQFLNVVVSQCLCVLKLF